jgi:outer membrane protein OmpA-like peptidoglycan-associated protein
VARRSSTRAAALAAALVAAFTAALWARQASSPRTITSDRDWKAHSASLSGTKEAAFIIRLGDVDNLGFGWPAGFDPFCGRMTESHEYPWPADKADVAGLDRMLVSSTFDPKVTDRACGMDGYSQSEDPRAARPVPYALPLDPLKGATISNAYLQLFIDDFQAPRFCSKFQVTLNGTRFVEAERVINAIEQTGPVGKLVTLKVPEEFYPALTGGGRLELRLEEVTGAADGFAVDFVRLLVNRSREAACRGDQAGTVIDKATLAPIKGATVVSGDAPPATTDESGRFLLKGIVSGFGAVTASAAGYNDNTTAVDVAEGGDENPEITIELERGSGMADFGGKNVSAGETLTLNNILFDQGKSELRPASLAELDRIAAFMKANPKAEIELSGHTSSEGDAAMNRSLSYARVKACKDYIVGRNIDTGRIVVAGYGPDRPVAPNDSEDGRARNRRVEMRVLKL